MKIQEVIAALLEGLPDTDLKRRWRLRVGVEHLIQINSLGNLNWSRAMNRYSIPIFARTVHQSTDLDVPVRTYVEDLRDFIAEHVEIDQAGRVFPLVIATHKTDDVEADTLELIKQMFIERNKA